MRLGEDGEAVAAIGIDHRHKDAEIRRMRAAVIGRVVEEGVAAPQVRVKLGHGARHDVRAGQHMDRQAFRRRQQMAIGGDDAAGEVLGAVQDARPARAQQGIGHLADDPFDPVVQDRQFRAVQSVVVMVVPFTDE